MTRILGLLLVAYAAVAADGVTGKWTMSQSPSNGGPPRVTTFDLKVDGTTLTGAVTAPMGGRPGGAAPTPIPISNPKISGNTITFEVIRVFAGAPVVTKYTGALSGDTLRIKQTIDLGDGPLTVEAEAKRSN
jgi:hypothetical protein